LAQGPGAVPAFARSPNARLIRPILSLTWDRAHLAGGDRSLVCRLRRGARGSPQVCANSSRRPTSTAGRSRATRRLAVCAISGLLCAFLRVPHTGPAPRCRSAITHRSGPPARHNRQSFTRSICKYSLYCLRATGWASEQRCGVPQRLLSAK
jgi:hypothetical protein